MKKILPKDQRKKKKIGKKKKKIDYFPDDDEEFENIIKYLEQKVKKWVRH
jgi:hypothetical protein